MLCLLSGTRQEYPLSWILFSVLLEVLVPQGKKRGKRTSINIIEVEVKLFIWKHDNLCRKLCGCSVAAVSELVWLHSWSVARKAPLLKFSRQNTGVGCHFLLQGIFLTQGSNPGLLHLHIGRQILYHLSTRVKTISKSLQKSEFNRIEGYGGGLVVKSCPTLAIPWTVPARPLCPWDSPGKNTGVDCHFLLQGIFLIEELNPGLLRCRI